MCLTSLHRQCPEPGRENCRLDSMDTDKRDWLRYSWYGDPSKVESLCYSLGEGWIGEVGAG